MEQQPWISDRKALELEDAERVAYFDRFIQPYLDGSQPFDVAISAYKETLEHQGIPLSPARVALAGLEATIDAA